VPGFAQIKAAARLAVHKQFAVPAVYYGAGFLAGVAVTVRLHSKLVTHGELATDGYAEVLENVTRLAFSETLLAADGVTLSVGGYVTLTDYEMSFTLSEAVPKDGPENIVWDVTRKRA